MLHAHHERSMRAQHERFMAPWKTAPMVGRPTRRTTSHKVNIPLTSQNQRLHARNRHPDYGYWLNTNTHANTQLGSGQGASTDTPSHTTGRRPCCTRAHAHSHPPTHLAVDPVVRVHTHTYTPACPPGQWPCCTRAYILLNNHPPTHLGADPVARAYAHT